MDPHRGQLAHQNHCPRRHAQHRRSSPIEIPARRRSGRNIRSPPRSVAASPELIFDMSPIERALDSVFSTGRAAGAYSLQRDDLSPSAGGVAQPFYTRREPFLYRFPMLSSHQSPSSLEHSAMSEVAPCRDAVDTPSNAISTVTQAYCEMHCIDQLRCGGEESPPTHVQSTLFAPTRAARAVTAPRIQPAEFLTRCNPSRPPRSPLSSSLFRSCEQSSFEDAALSCSSMDGNVVGFESYLIQRIDDERSVRVSHREPISSVRVSVRV